MFGGLAEAVSPTVEASAPARRGLARSANSVLGEYPHGMWSVFGSAAEDTRGEPPAGCGLMALGRAYSVAVRGLDGSIVEIEADISSGLPAYTWWAWRMPIAGVP